MVRFSSRINVAQQNANNSRIPTKSKEVRTVKASRTARAMANAHRTQTGIQIYSSEEVKLCAKIIIRHLPWILPPDPLKWRRARLWP